MIKHSMKHGNDCFTCCLATVLGLEYEEVPRFFNDNDEPVGEWYVVVSEFLSEHKLQMIEATMPPESIALMKGLSIASGPSPTPEYRDKGVFHAVVYKDGKLFHDSIPNPKGEITPELVTFLIPIYDGERYA